VVRGVEVFGGMLVFRRIAAANMPAFETEAQVYPRVPDSQTILAAIRAGRDWSYLVKMCTLFSHRKYPFGFFMMLFCQFVASCLL
jgi:hypothetical protein